jgi:DNA-3-methyladenine glycosylase II
MPTSMSPLEAAALIVRRDPTFKSVVSHVGPPPRWRSARVDERFGALVRSITFQLLATSAAGTIHGRVQALCGDAVTPDSVLRAGVDRLRTAGLSRTKAEAMVELASQVGEGTVQLSHHGRMSDDDVIRQVTTVRGIGPWTAHMYLLGTLARPDVWPVGDFGVRNGWSMVHDLDEIVDESALREAGDKFAGVRSSLAWYCWQAVHLERRAK